MKSNLTVSTYAELEWGFTGDPRITLDHYERPSNGWPHSVTVDPTPCYAHDEDRVIEMLDKVASVAPPMTDAHIGCLAFEELSRTNGHATQADNCYHSDPNHPAEQCPRPWTGVIVLLGKRIPPHPAMTRYLVAHEYGHLVDYWLSGGRDNQRVSSEYAKIRGLTKPKAYGPGTWHLTPGEVFANDFRILVTKTETEFWPHPSISHPSGNRKLRTWWKEAMEKLQSIPNEPELKAA